MKDLIEQTINQLSNRTISTDEAIETIMQKIFFGRFVVFENEGNEYIQSSIVFDSYEKAIKYVERSVYKNNLTVMQIL